MTDHELRDCWIFVTIVRVDGSRENRTRPNLTAARRLVGAYVEDRGVEFCAIRAEDPRTGRSVFDEHYTCEGVVSPALDESYWTTPYGAVPSRVRA